MSHSDLPEWVKLSEAANAPTNKQVAEVISNLSLPIDVRYTPMQAHWFMLDSLLIANRANQDGMHAIAVALTRQTLEAMTIVELGLVQHNHAGSILAKWNENSISPGELRK